MLSTDERQEICRMWAEKTSQAEIARNACSHDGGYCCEVAAHRAHQWRRQANEARRKLERTRLGEEV